jgi:hypothetical protein
MHVDVPTSPCDAGSEVLAALPPNTYQHARHTIRGVVDEDDHLTFYSGLTHGHVRILLRDPRRAGYTIRRSESEQ